MSAATRLPRGQASGWLWRLLWLSLLVLFCVEVLDAWQRSAPLTVWVFWLTPLVVLVPGLLRDRLRSVTWLAFVSLLYFILAVLRIFAEPESARAQIELIAVIGLFSSAGLYVRERARDFARERDTDARGDAGHNEAHNKAHNKAHSKANNETNSATQNAGNEE